LRREHQSVRQNINDLWAFIAVASDKSFTRAAARLGMSPSVLSRTVRKLEEQLGVRLLIRTTRSVSLTEAGERLLERVGPRLDEIELELGALSQLRDKPAGTVRINCSEYAAQTVVWPRLFEVLPAYPDITVEIYIDNGFTDIAAERFDAGVRLGDSLEKDMIAVRIAPDDRLVAVGSPAYFATRKIPLIPQDLTAHSCINLRLATRGGLYAWEFEKDGEALRAKVEGQLIFNTITPMIEGALAGLGIALVPESGVREHVADGSLVQVLGEWCPTFAGFHLYYPSRRQQSPAFQIIVDALRYRAS
jgi:DNA-binding transcriptional LysR family regulator